MVINFIWRNKINPNKIYESFSDIFQSYSIKQWSDLDCMANSDHSGYDLSCKILFKFHLSLKMEIYTPHLWNYMLFIMISWLFIHFKFILQFHISLARCGLDQFKMSPIRLKSDLPLAPISWYLYVASREIYGNPDTGQMWRE